MRAVVLALCGLMLGQLARADDLAKEQLFNMWARDFTQKLQGKVLPGWIVLYEEKDHTIKIMRDRAAVSHLVAPDSSGNELEQLAWPSLSFKVMPYVSPGEYQRQKAENEVSKKTLHQLPDGYDHELSFAWLTPKPLWSSGMVPRDEYVRQEGETVFKQANAAFSKY